MQRIVSLRALRYREPASARRDEEKGRGGREEGDGPQALPDRLGDAAEEDAWRVDDAQASDRRDVGRDDRLGVGARVKQAARQLLAQAGDEERALLGLEEASLRARETA